MRTPPKKIRGLIALAIALVAALACALSPALAAASPATPHGSVRASSPPRARASIVNGIAAQPGTFPWLVVIFHEGEGESFQCTGTVVSPNVVLTAAHCVENPRTGARYSAAGYFVVTGTVDWTLTPRQVLGVSTTVVYPSFNRLYASGDAALLVLSTPTTAPVLALASAATDGASLAPGHHVLMAGWGETFPGSPVPHELHWAGTAVQSTHYCQLHTRVYLPSEELCTLDSPAHRTVACFGDSGGPLLGALPATGEVVELGVASHLYSDCRPISPVVYTRADLISTWVHDWISSASYLPGTVTPATANNTVADGTPSGGVTPGVYSAQPTAGQAITMHVAGNGEWITEVLATVRVSCRRGATLTLALSWPTEALFISGGLAGGVLPISPTGHIRGGSARLSVQFTAQGTLQGQLTVRASGSGRHLGICTAQLPFMASS